MNKIPKFEYVAKDNRGKTNEGVLEAATLKDAAFILRNNSFYPIEITPQNINKSKELFARKEIKTRDLAIFCRQFATTLKSGIPVVDSLDIIHKQIENKKLAKIIAEVYEYIQKGYPVSEALADHPKAFPPLLVNMVETGEISGTLDVVMERMAIHYEKENKTHQKIQAAITYPIVVFVVAILVVVFLLTFVMPTFVGMFDNMGAELPLATRVLMFISSGLSRFWYIFGLLILFSQYILHKYMKTPQGKYNIDKLLLKIPIWGKVQNKVIVSRFTRTMSVLLSSGVDLLQALDIVKRVIDNEFIHKKICDIEEGVSRGISLAELIRNTHIFPPMVYQMIKVGEDSGSLDFVLEKTANFYDDEVETAISQMTTMIEPIIIVFLGGIVGFMVLAMLLPMFDMYSAIG